MAKHNKHKEGLKLEKKIKTFKSEFYSINSIFGNDWAKFFVLMGGRQTGKSYAAMRWAVLRKLRLGEKFKFYWLRLTDAQATMLLKGGAANLIDPDIKRKYNIKTMVKGDTVYTYKEDENGKKIEIKEFCTILSCSTFYASKGVGYYDKDFDGEYFLVLDEMNRESCERNTFDIVYAFSNLMHNLVRSTHDRIRVVMIGNTLSEASDLLSAFNFIPPSLGRFKLKSQLLVVDNIKRSDSNQAIIDKGLSVKLTGKDSTFTNEIEVDSTVLINKRKCIRPQYVIAFSSKKSDWYTVWNDNIIKPYNGEKKQIFGMNRYLNYIYDTDLINAMFDIFSAKMYKFTNLATFKQFQKHLKLLKK